MIEFVNVADIINPKTGITPRQENKEKSHKYQVGDAVKLDDQGWVTITKLTRDCDGTPLYNYELCGLSEDSIIDSLHKVEI